MFENISKKIHSKSSPSSPAANSIDANTLERQEHSLNGSPSPSPRATEPKRHSFTGSRLSRFGSDASRKHSFRKVPSSPLSIGPQGSPTPARSPPQVAKPVTSPTHSVQLAEENRHNGLNVPESSPGLSRASSSKINSHDRSRVAQNVQLQSAQAQSALGDSSHEPEPEKSFTFDQDHDHTFDHDDTSSFASAKNHLDDAEDGDGIYKGFRPSPHYSIMLSEAAADTPAFRASTEYIDIQVKSLEQWLISFASKAANLVDKLSTVKDAVNELIGIFMPSATHSSILQHDYTTLFFGRYTETESRFWTDLLAVATRNSHEIHEMVKALQEKTFSKYNEARSAYLLALKEQDDATAAYFRMPYHSEPAALRDVSFAAYKASSKYLKAATQYCISISELEADATVHLLETMNHQYLDVPAGLQAFDPNFIEVSIEFHRLKTFAESLRKSLPRVKSDLRRVRNKLLKEYRKEKPPTSLKHYYEKELPLTEGFPNYKSGWVNVEIKPGVWYLLWAFLENGLFGFIGMYESGTAVVESTRFSVEECQFELIASETRRCLFRITGPELTVTVQALGRLDLAQWQHAFKTSVAILQDIKLPDAVLNSKLDEELSNSSRDKLTPWSRAFSIPGLSINISPRAETVLSRIRDVRNDVNSPQWLRYDSTITSSTLTIGSTVPAVKPLPTAAPLEATVANAFFKPQGQFPNAITSNIWGCVGSKVVNGGKHEQIVRVHYDNKFPSYPVNYPRALIVQDMDMRGIISPLQGEQNIGHDDFLLFFIRATRVMHENEVPVRIYVTSRKVFVYSSWAGIVHLDSVDIANILDVEHRHGVDASFLNIIIQEPQTGHAISKLEFKLYIDSGKLAKQRLDLVLRNARTREPKTCQQLLEPLVLMCVEYTSELKNDEFRKESAIGISDQPQYEDQIYGPMTNFKPGRQALATRWLQAPVGSSSNSSNPEIPMETAKLEEKKSQKVAEDTFPITAAALFVIVFGPRSPVFNGRHHVVAESDITAGPWYRKGKRVERRLAQKIYLGSTANERFSYQRIDRQEADMFIVTERSSSWEMPRGDQFYNIQKYVIYNNEQGCQLQIWCRVVWQQRFSGQDAEESVGPILKVIAQERLLRIREAASGINSLEEAYKSFGRVRATKVLSEGISYDKDEDIQVTRVSTRTMGYILFRSPFLFSLELLKWFGMNLFHRLMQVSGPRILLCLLLLTSMFANFRLYERSRENYWSAYLETQETNDYIDRLKLSQDPKSMVFTRAIYSQDLDDLISEGTLWTAQIGSSNASIGNGSAISLGDSSLRGCSAKFQELAQLSLDDYGSLYELEPHVQTTLDRINALRLDFAIRRNDLMTMIRMLNMKEYETLIQEYRSWLINETAMCARVRPTLKMLNGTVLEEIKQYCISCLEEAKAFF